MKKENEMLEEIKEFHTDLKEKIQKVKSLQKEIKGEKKDD